MPPRAADHKPPTDIQEGPEASKRKVLPFRRGISVSTASVQSPFESELGEIEYEISNLGQRPIPVVMERVIERIRSLTHADGAALAIRDEQGVYCLASVGDAPEVGSRLQPESGLTRECFESSQVVLCDDAERDSRVRLAVAKNLRLGSALVVPIQRQGSVLGVLEVLSSRRAAFDNVHVAALQRVALSLAPVLAPVPQPEQRAPLGLWLAVGAALLLGLGLFFWWTFSHRRATSSPVSPPATFARGSQAEGAKRAAPSESQSAVSSARSSPPEFPAPTIPGTAPAAVTAPVIPVADFTLQRSLQGHAGWVGSVSFTADGQRLVSGGRDQAVKFWDVRSGKEVGALGAGKEIEAVAVSRDGHWVAAESPGNMSIIWDATTGREVHTLAGHRPPNLLATTWVYSIAFSPDGRWLASGVDDKTVRLWDVKTGQGLRDLSAQRRSVIYIAVSPDGRLLASGGDSKTIRIWDVATGQVIRTLSGHKKGVYAVAFSPQGRWLASASGDKTVKLWDVDSGRELHTLTGHRNRVTTLAFSPDGRWLATGSWDKTIRVWDVADGRELQTLAGDTGRIYTVAFDPRGQWLASGSENGAIQIWHLRPTQAATEAEPTGIGNRVGSATPPER